LRSGIDPTTDVKKLREYGRQCMVDQEDTARLRDAPLVLAALKELATGSGDD